MWGDIRYGLRQAARNPFFSAVVVLLVALGIGANALIFCWIDALLLRPLPVRHPGNLYRLQRVRRLQVRPDVEFSYAQYLQLARRTDVFSAVIAEQELQDWTHTNLFPLDTGDAVRLIHTQFVSPDYFQQLGLRAFRGRLLTPEDAKTSGAIPAVLSYGFWRSQFAGDDAVIGRTFQLKQQPFTVVGVVSPAFHDIDIERSPDIRLPVSAALPLLGYAVDDPRGDNRVPFEILVRLAPNVSASAAEAGILPTLQAAGEAAMRQWVAEHKSLSESEIGALIENETNYRLEAVPVAHGVSQLRDQFSHALALLLGGVGLMLVAVCANIAGLLLVRSEQRRREIAVRLALGAKSGRILRQLLAENFVLAVPGALAAVLLTYWLAPEILRLMPVLRGLDLAITPRALTVEPDIRVLAFAVALSLVSVVAFGIGPALRVSRLTLYSELQASGRTVARARIGLAAVAVQVGVSLVLLIAALLMLRTLLKLEKLDPGFDRAHIVEFTIDAGAGGYSGAQAASFAREFRDRVASLPGVRAVSYANLGVMRGIGQKGTVTTPGVNLNRDVFLNTSINQVESSYFDTMGIPLVEGRNLALDDVGRKPLPVIVNRAFAQQFFPRGGAVGSAVMYGRDGSRPPDFVVVGISGDAKYRSFREPDPPIFYTPFDLPRRAHEPLLLYLRTHGDPRALVQSVRRVLAQLGPGVPLVEVETLEDEVQNSLWQERLLALFCGFFGGAAVLLAAIGLYATLAYSVSRRGRELGVRIALGARTAHIVRTVSAHLAWFVLAGLAAGIVAAMLLVNTTRHFLYGMEPLDLPSFAIAAGVIVALAVLAAAIPSARAIHTDPAVVLRQE